MSAISTGSPLLPLLLTMIILCEARQLSDTKIPKEEPDKRSHLSSKKLDEAAAKVPNTSSSIAALDSKPAALSTTAEETMEQKKGVTEEKRVADVHTTAKKDPRSSNLKKKHQPIKQQSSSSKGKNKWAGDESGKNSVSWRVPHKKKKRSTEHEPGFNLDYSPPKTHPPSHN